MESMPPPAGAADLPFILWAGQQFVRELSLDAAASNAPRQIVDDWNTLSGWLHSEVGGLKEDPWRKARMAWGGYLAAGASPSPALATSFAAYRLQAISEGWITLTPPPEVVMVFNRLVSMERSMGSMKGGVMLRPPQLSVAAAPRKKFKWSEQNLGIACFCLGIILVLLSLRPDPWDSNTKLRVAGALCMVGGLALRALAHLSNLRAPK